MTIFVVTSGSYSDYGINAVFTDRALAEAFVSKFNAVERYEDASIEEWEANVPDLRGHSVFFVRMTRSGDVRECNEVARSSYWLDSAPSTDLGGNLISTHVAKDKEHAIKIMNERRTAWLLEHNK